MGLRDDPDVPDRRLVSGGGTRSPGMTSSVVLGVVVALVGVGVAAFAVTVLL